MDIKCINNMKDKLNNIGVAMAVMVLLNYDSYCNPHTLLPVAIK